MKEHIPAALQEQFYGCEELLASLSDEEITAPHGYDKFDSNSLVYSESDINHIEFQNARCYAVLRNTTSIKFQHCWV